MDYFYEVYEKSVEILKTQSLNPSWKSVQDSLKMVLKPQGPDAAVGVGVDSVRNKLVEKKPGVRGVKTAIADAIVNASQPDVAGFQERAALLKTMQHFYLVEKKGAQSIWVMDAPKKYTDWPFDLFANKNEASIHAELMHVEELFGEDYRKIFADAAQLARKWSTDVEIKLALADAETLNVVKRWFHLENDDEASVRKSVPTLLNGFRKISRACNASAIYFSDTPPNRRDCNSAGQVAAVGQGETMQVIYLFNSFMRIAQTAKSGSGSQLWLCAITLIHELSHKLLDTEDHQYDHMGLKVKPGFSTAKALSNAESWGFFAGDLVGVLPPLIRLEALK